MTKDKYLLTGATGFFGSVIRKELRESHSIVTLGRSSDNDYQVDLSEQIPTFTESFDVVIHNAGKAHSIPRNESERSLFYKVNVDGTRNLLAGLAQSAKLPRSLIFISSISVYGLTSGEQLSEETPLNATDAYGKSKILAEDLLLQWTKGNGVSLTILRLPLIIGKNPVGNLRSMVQGIKSGLYFSIGDASARKSMVMAEDVAKLISKDVKVPGIFNLTDGYHPSFHELEVRIASSLGKKKPLTIPRWIAVTLGMLGSLMKTLTGRAPVTLETIRKITSTLTFDDSRARKELGWNPRKVLDAFEPG